MNNTEIQIFGKKNVELFTISFCLILFLIRTTIPVLKYPFLLLYIVLVSYILLEKRSRLFSDFKSSKNLPVTLILLFLYILLACFFSDKIYLSVIKDIINIVVLFTIMLMTAVFADDNNDLKILQRHFLNLLLVFALIISIQRIYAYFYLSSYSNGILHNKTDAVDTNFALLPVFFGMIGSVYYLFRETKGYKIFLLNILLFVCSINISLSGSRRGMVIFALFYLAIVIIQLGRFISNNQKIKLIYKNTFGYFLSFSLFIVITPAILLKTSVYFKNNVLEGLGIKNKAYTKIIIGQTILSYLHIINKDINGEGIYEKIWHPVFDPKDPEAGTGNGNYKIAYTLTGKNVEIVPEGSKGYLLDKTCIGDSSLTHAYFFQLINSRAVEKGDSLVASIYCFVSEDFNGTATAFRALGSVSGEADKYYDLDKKGSWQKLIVPISCEKGELKIYLYLNKGEVRNFSTLTGYVIFAYPEFTRIFRNKNISVSSLNDNKAFGKSSLIKEIDIDKSERKKNLPDLRKVNSAGLSIFQIDLITNLKSVSDSDPARKWIAKLVSEDTIYHRYKANLGLPLSSDKFGEDRISRWKFALKIFNIEYNWPKKIFGGGFNFLNWYGYFFLNDKTKTDYPHNPFLHILLYSGLLGLIIYFLFLYKVFYYYIKYVKEYPLLLFFFLLTFYFTLFSGGSPFDPPIMGFFMVLPFVIHSINNRERLKVLS